MNAPATVTIPRAEYDGLLAALEDAEDRATIASAREREIRLGKEAAREDYLPIEAVERLLAGESPVQVWREHRGLTLDELARAASLDVGALTILEADGVAIEPDMALAIADALHIDADELRQAGTVDGTAEASSDPPLPALIAEDTDEQHRYRILRTEEGYSLGARQRSQVGLFLPTTWLFPSENTARAGLETIKAFNAWWYAIVSGHPTAGLDRRAIEAEERLSELMAQIKGARIELPKRG